jgi:hypothetical protein
MKQTFASRPTGLKYFEERFILAQSVWKEIQPNIMKINVVEKTIRNLVA